MRLVESRMHAPEIKRKEERGTPRGPFRLQANTEPSNGKPCTGQELRVNHKGNVQTRRKGKDIL